MDGDYVFDAFGIPREKIKSIAEDLYKIGIKRHMYEACTFSLYWSMKYDFSLEMNYVEESIDSTDCCFMLLAYLKVKRNRNKEAKKKLKSKAKSLVDEIDKYWIFVYEILSKEELPIGEYLTLKKRGISFIKTEFQ